MHDLAAMIADLREAIADMPIAATILHTTGGKTELTSCAVSDLQGADRMIEDEGIMVEADISLTYALPDVTKSVDAGTNVKIRGKSYRVVRVRRDRSNSVSVTLDCKELR
jgi:hypothetical protein